MFSQRLKEAMGEKGLKQVNLLHIASDQGVKLGKSQLSQYLSGKTVPRRDMLAFLASSLGSNFELESPCFTFLRYISRRPLQRRRDYYQPG